MIARLVTNWTNCYDANWNGLIVREAFAHPAKFARALIQRIIETGLQRGYWRKGDLLGDPFGGVALGGIIAGYQGLNWVGVELEPKFVDLGNQNLAMHGPQFMACGATMVKLVQGDSRRFAEIVGQAGGIVMSPPFLTSDNAQGKGIASEGGAREGSTCQDWSYGQTPGNIGNLKAGTLEGVVTSPPYADQDTNGARENWVKNLEAAGIAHDQGDTYWSAMSLVYTQCRLALKPGGVMAVVVKDHVKGGKRVPLCDQTVQLLTSLGFEVFERCWAMLVKENRHPGLFGADVVKTTERKSFFRRLAEKKGSPPINQEEVLWSRSL